VHAHGVKQERVAVRRRARDRRGPNIAGRTGTVFYHDGLAKRLLQMTAHEARKNVGRTTGRERHNQVDVARRIASIGSVLRECEAQRRGGDKSAKASHYGSTGWQCHQGSPASTYTALLLNLADLSTRFGRSGPAA
jgi:hypothetical protein